MPLPLAGEVAPKARVREAEAEYSDRLHPAALSALRMPPKRPCAAPQPPEGGFDLFRKREQDPTGQSMRSAPPRYGRSTSGTLIEPSAFW